MTGVRTEFRRLSRYGLVGLATNLSLYLVFLLLLRASIVPTVAAGLCYVLGVGLSYLLNRSWTFASPGSHGRDLPKFLLAYCVGLFSTLATISLLTLWLPAELAQILNIGITAIVIYGSLRLFGFGSQEEADGN